MAKTISVFITRRNKICAAKVEILKRAITNWINNPGSINFPTTETKRMVARNQHPNISKNDFGKLFNAFIKPSLSFDHFVSFNLPSVLKQTIKCVTRYLNTVWHKR